MAEPGAREEDLKFSPWQKVDAEGEAPSARYPSSLTAVWYMTLCCIGMVMCVH